MDETFWNLSHRRTIPSMESERLENFEAPVMVGPVPAGFTPGGFKAAWTYTEMVIMVGFQRVHHHKSHFPSVLGEVVLKVRRQRWDMGGSYMRMENVNPDELDRPLEIE